MRFSVEVSSSCSCPMLPVALSCGYCSTTTIGRERAPDRAFSAWLICFMPSGPAAPALIFTAWFRAWITASSVDFSKSIAPLTALTRFGIRSCRRLSWTSICLKAFSVWFLREISQLKAATIHNTTPATKISRINEPIGAPGYGESRISLRRQVRQQFRERLPDHLGDARFLGPDAGERMVGIHVQLHAVPDRNAPPRGRAAGVLGGVARPPRGERAARAAARHPLRAPQRQSVGQR